MAITDIGLFETCQHTSLTQKKGDCSKCIEEVMVEVARRALQAALDFDGPTAGSDNGHSSVCSCCGGRSVLVHLIRNITTDTLYTPREVFPESDPPEDA